MKIKKNFMMHVEQNQMMKTIMFHLAKELNKKQINNIKKIKKKIKKRYFKISMHFLIQK